MDTARTAQPEIDHRTAPSVVPLDRILKQVRAYWGFDTLRPLQEEGVRAGLDGRDSVVVLPTGGGKSLCYQVPPLLTDRTDIVVSPLISLMKDQVDGLRACGYPAAAIHSGLPNEENNETLRGLRAGRFRLIFVSPERLLSSGFLNLIEQANVRAFAIDEAHCISQWGHDFRREYRRLDLLKQRFPNAAVHAFTATATQRVREDIAAQLNLTDPLMLVGTFDRPNLTYRIVPRLDVHAQVIDVLSRHRREGTIVYCLSRKDTEAMADALTSAGIDARPYHAGLSPEQRQETQEAFASESLSVVTATVAFGMGIDRSNVRCIVHATMPKSVEHYQQETGRAGRDGLEAECVLFYSAADFMRWQSLIARSAADAEDSARIIETQTTLIDQIRRLCSAPKCRHRALSEYFGQSYAKTNCEACDVCLNETEGLEDATEVAQKILSTVARLARHSGFSFGVVHTVDVLSGANTELIRRRGHDQLSTYGILRGTPKKTLSNWIYQLVDQGLLDRNVSDHPVLELNDASWEAMRGEREVRLIRVAEKPLRKSRDATASWEGVDRGLFDHLRNARQELAKAAGVPAFVIFSDRTLRDLACRRPTDTENLGQIHGIGAAKLAKYGDRFVKEIGSYCGEHGVPTDVDADPIPLGSDDIASTTVARSSRRTVKMSQTKRTAFDLFRLGQSIDAVTEAVGRKPNTVSAYLSEFIEATKPASIERWMDAKTYDLVARAAGEVGVERLKPIFEHLNKKVSYDEIRLVLTHLDARND